MAKQGALDIDESMIDTVLAQDINFSGTMRFSKSLMIKGKFDGDIDATGHLIIGPGATAKATIKAGVITNYGTIHGNVTATERLELFNNAKLNGDIETPELIIESGCSYNGQCKMTEKTVSHSPQPSQSSQHSQQKK